METVVEKIIRERIFDSVYWKQHCFELNAATLLDKAVQIQTIGGTYSNQKPTEFLSLTLKLLLIQPSFEIIMEYIRQEEFKYLRALGAFYLRLTGDAVQVYTHLEPLLEDYRKLRIRKADGSCCLSTIDSFIEELLQEERVCDIILPRLQKREVLEDTGQLEPRASPLQEEYESLLEQQEEQKEEEQEEQEEPKFKIGGKLKLKKKKKKEETKQPEEKEKETSGFKEEMSIEETNRIRISLGLKPLTT